MSLRSSLSLRNFPVVWQISLARQQMMKRFQKFGFFEVTGNELKLEVIKLWGSQYSDFQEFLTSSPAFSFLNLSLKTVHCFTVAFMDFYVLNVLPFKFSFSNKHVKITKGVYSS